MSGDANVYGPASRPLFDPAPVRGQRKFRQPEGLNGGTNSNPRFSFPGVLNFADITPDWAIDEDTTYLEAMVTMTIGSGTGPITLVIRKNDSLSVFLSSIPALRWQRYDISLTCLQNDRVQLQVVSFGNGLLSDLAVVLRPFVTTGFPI